MDIDAAPIGARQPLADGFGQGHVAATDVQTPHRVTIGVRTVDGIGEKFSQSIDPVMMRRLLVQTHYGIFKGVAIGTG